LYLVRDIADVRERSGARLRIVRPQTAEPRQRRRMNIEQRLAGAIQALSLDALAGAVPLNVDLDVVLSVLARTAGGGAPYPESLTQLRAGPASQVGHRAVGRS
jgi:hypothetical protein